MDTAAAMSQIRKAIESDPGYRQSWVANIACAVMDEAPEVDQQTRDAIANRFLGWMLMDAS